MTVWRVQRNFEASNKNRDPWDRLHPRAVLGRREHLGRETSHSIHDASLGIIVVMTSMNAGDTSLLSYVDNSAGSALRFRVQPQIYSNRLSDDVSGNTIKKLNLPREELVILTKASLLPGRANYSGMNTVFNPAAAESAINQKGLNGKHIFDSVKASLKSLQLEHIDVLQYHRLRIYYAD
ncbi:hypothetical protein VTO73DRAFT_6198 [Trametes versicolor]